MLHLRALCHTETSAFNYFFLNTSNLLPLTKHLCFTGFHKLMIGHCDSNEEFIMPEQVRTCQNNNNTHNKEKDDDDDNSSIQ